MRCGRCDEEVNAAAKFCGECGAAIANAPEADATSDVKEYAKELLAEGKSVAGDALEATKASLKTERGKSVAACAAIGAALAVPVPFVGPIAGAAVGAGIGMLRKLK